MSNLQEIVKYSKNLKLLFVEDNQDAREMTSILLSSFFDHIIEAENGSEGLEKFKNNDIDLVITDINMPIMDGLELCRSIREIDQEVPLLILSAHDETNYFIESIEIGINGYMLKPIDLDQLTDTLYRVTRKYKYKMEAKHNLHLLHQYQEATDQSSLVSKIDTEGIVTYVNDAFCNISGYSREELIEKRHDIVMHTHNLEDTLEDIWSTIKEEKKIWKGIIRNITKTGKSYYTDNIIMPILDPHGDIMEYISIGHEITDIMNPSKQLVDAINNATDLILVYMKLDKYHLAEDFYSTKSIEEIQDRVRIFLEEELSKLYDFDIIYQLGNGEYGLVLDGTTCKKDRDRLIKELMSFQESIVDNKINIEDIEYDINILISLVFDKKKILESARLGIKEILKTKKEFIVADSMAETEYERALKNMKTISILKTAIKESNIVSYFQPIVDNNTQEVVKHESLVRLIDNRGDIMTPASFLDISKQGDYYSKISEIVMDHSFEFLHERETDVSINLSALDIEQKATREKILCLLKTHNKYASRVVFELLEDEGIRDFGIISNFIQKVKKLGVKIAIDDFGAGYSNFERLLDFQPDIIKIDGSLIRNIETSAHSLSAVKSIVTFAKEQNIQTIAEFIENESIFNIVKELGIDYSQGYYFGKPEPLKS